MKQQILRRIVAAMLSAIMVFATVACASTKEESKESKQSQASSQNSESQKSSEVKEEVKKEDPVTVKWLIFDDESKDHDMVMEKLNEYMVEKINVKLDLEVIATGEYKTRCQLATSSKEDFDIFWVANWLNPISGYLTDESLMPLDDLLAEYGQGITSTVDDWVLDYGKMGGTLYAIPNLQILAGQKCFVVAKDLADKYNLDMDHADDWYDIVPFLETIKENEPNLVPLGITQPYSQYGYETITSYLSVKKGQADIELVTDGSAWYQEAVFFKTMLDKGYLREDSYTASDNNEWRKANRFAVNMDNYKPGIEANLKSSYGMDFKVIPIGTPYVNYNSGAATMTAINVNSKNPEAAMKVIDFLYTDKEAFNMLLFGLEGVHYNWVDDEHIKAVENTTYSSSNYGWTMGNQFNAYPIEGQDADVWVQTDKLNRDAEVSPLNGFVFDNSNVQTEIAQVSAVEKEYSKWYWNTDDLDKTFKEFMDKLDTAGRQVIAAELQRQIDEFVASKK